MNHALLRYADKLALALKRMDQPYRNLRQVQIWAEQHNHPYLSQGALGLIDTLAR